MCVTFALSGMGEVWLDDVVEIQVVENPSILFSAQILIYGAMFASRAQRGSKNVRS